MSRRVSETSRNIARDLIAGVKKGDEDGAASAVAWLLEEAVACALIAVQRDFDVARRPVPKASPWGTPDRRRVVFPFGGADRSLSMTEARDLVARITKAMAEPVDEGEANAPAAAVPAPKRRRKP